MTAITLDHDEAAALALRIVARHVTLDFAPWWEDVPTLDEDSYHLLCRAIGEVGRELETMSDRRDRALDIDSQDLLEQAW